MNFSDGINGSNIRAVFKRQVSCTFVQTIEKNGKNNLKKTILMVPANLTVRTSSKLPNRKSEKRTQVLIDIQIGLS